jgi:UDP-N-acetylmuramyl pentapeptide phosphotransferase/UDP-N-acetylglucosamine-1-phosphate transferase
LLETILPMAITILIGFIITLLLIPSVSKFMFKHGIIGIDVHKLDRPKIPELCGITIVIGVTVSAIIFSLFYPEQNIWILAFVSSTLIAAIVGILDRITKIGPRLKPVLVALGAIPIIFLAVYNPYPEFPFIGATRLTIIYPLLIPIALAVTANSVNMLDVFNGSMTGTCSIAILGMIICMLMMGRVDAAALAAALLGSLLAFHIFNKYPAKVFAGDVGSLFIGGSIGVLAIYGRIEVAAITAMMPHIMNAFYGLATVGRLYERKEISTRPIRVLEDGRLEVNKDSKAPITLARMILAQRPLKEFEVTRRMFILSTVSAILAVLTQLLIIWW